MSAKVSGLIWDLAIQRTAKIVLLRLADHGNDQGKSIFPGMESLADSTDADERTVQRILRDLEALGVLRDVGEVKYGRGKTRGWHLDLAALKRTFPTTRALRRVTPRGKRVVPPSPKMLLAGTWQMPAPGAEEAGEEGTAGEAEEGMENPGATPPFTSNARPENPGAMPPFQDGKNPGVESQKGGKSTPKGWHDAPPEPERTIKERGAGAGGAPARPEGAGACGAGPAPEPLQPVNAAWKAARPFFAKRHGEAKARSWWDCCIPLRYEPGADRETLVLGVATRWWAEDMPRRWGYEMHRALLQAGYAVQLRFEFSEIARAATAAARAKAKA